MKLKNYPAEIRARLAELDERIRYQENPPEVTTMSGCMECGTITRGGGLCPACLRDMKERVMAKADEAHRDKVRGYQREYKRKMRKAP